MNGGLDREDARRRGYDLSDFEPLERQGRQLAGAIVDLAAWREATTADLTTDRHERRVAPYRHPEESRL